MRRVHVRQTYRDPHGWERTARRLGPLDEADRIVEVGLDRAPVRLGDPGEPVEIEMRHGYATLVPVADRVGRARHGRFDAERAASATDERRLARPELAGDGDDVAGPQMNGDARGERFGLLGGASLDLGQNSPS